MGAVESLPSATLTWPLHVRYVTVTRQVHGRYMTVTRGALGNDRLIVAAGGGRHPGRHEAKLAAPKLTPAGRSAPPLERDRGEGAVEVAMAAQLESRVRHVAEGGDGSSARVSRDVIQTIQTNVGGRGACTSVWRERDVGAT